MLHANTRVTQQSKALNLSARRVTTDPGSIPGCITTGRVWESHREAHNWTSVVRVRVWLGYAVIVNKNALIVVTGRDREVRGATHNWPSVVRVRPVGLSLSHRAPATPVAGRAQCALTKVARCTVFPPTHLCGWVCGVLRSSLVGVCFGEHMAFDLRLSQAHTGVVAMRQDSNYYQLDTTKLGRKRG